ncbi:PREDICTED: prostaglandin F2-alpha receptor isoform X2 [Colobus angolensis palliatus]|uniref:prostaglandin F2-alpha receptor isoform X2 n=1 Tax=Colobus angolensis palliatus TaxID=336983 RepID=UPI0005F48340|nr:PREDICTED: prostaglandin F2-alpha receptor isoform X2 [Colobus angolensis palliatus]
MSMNNSKQPVSPAAGLLSNTTCQTENRLSVFFSVIFMTVGILSNSLAIAILMKAYQRFRQKSKASFLLLASGLVITDFFGHLINGAIAVFVYASDKDWIRFDQSNVLCSIFGICMVFSGLCPLLLGSVMAIERCIGVTKPIFHSTKITSKHVKMMLSGVCLFAVFIALLPILGHRDYKIQASRTWCFYNTEDIKDWEDRFYLLLFSFLGLLALGVSLLCNAITGITLLRVKFKSQQHRQGRSHHLEMVIQLLAIMCVSCICWSPFLGYRIILNGKEKYKVHEEQSDFLCSDKTLNEKGQKNKVWVERQHESGSNNLYMGAGSDVTSEAPELEVYAIK